jgi:hypothetical protein
MAPDDTTVGRTPFRTNTQNSSQILTQNNFQNHNPGRFEYSARQSELRFGVTPPFVKNCTLRVGKNKMAPSNMLKAQLYIATTSGTGVNPEDCRPNFAAIFFRVALT